MSEICNAKETVEWVNSVLADTAFRAEQLYGEEFSLKPIPQKYLTCIHLYYGCGHHLYFFTNDVSQEEFDEVVAQLPRYWHTELLYEKVENRAHIAVIDCEFGYIQNILGPT